MARSKLSQLGLNVHFKDHKLIESKAAISVIGASEKGLSPKQCSQLADWMEWSLIPRLREFARENSSKAKAKPIKANKPKTKKV